MEDTIVLYASPEHLNSMLILAHFIAKHHPSLSIMILSTASASDAASVAEVPSITYYRLPAAALPPNLPTNLFELFFEIPRLHNPILSETLQGISKKSRIKAFVMDFFCNSAYEVSTSLNIPTYFYVSSGGFHACLLLYFPTLHETIFPKDIGGLNDFLEIPGCPPIHSLDFPDSVAVRESNSYKHVLNTGINMRKSAGIIANSFEALELKAREALSNDLCTPNGRTPPVFSIGPLVGEEKISSDGIASHECLRWLDLQPRKSVIFLCFGRRGLFSANQLKEMAIGLEKCGHRFLWVVRIPPGNQQSEPDLNAPLPDGFLERTKNRGFVLTSWAPQKEILSHTSVGIFVTHCGWSSVLESVSFEVPMICWPLYAEQKMNRVFIVEEIKVGLPLEAEADDGFVTADQLETRIREVMNSEKMKVIQGRVKEMKKAGETAVISGGSSVVALEKFIELVRQDH